MNRKLSSILFLAFVVAAISSYLVYRIAGKQMHPAAGPTTIRIVVATRDLPIGATVRDADVTTGQWLGSLPRGAFVSPKGVVGRVVVSNVDEGEPFSIAVWLLRDRAADSQLLLSRG